MKTNFVFDMGECSVERIRRVRNLQMRVTFEGEEVGKVPPDTLIGAANPSVRVMPSPREFINGFLPEEVPPLVMPESKPVREARFIRLRKKAQEPLQVLSRFELRPPRDVPRHDLCLVEVAHLHGDGKCLKQATPAVTDDCLDLPSLCGQLFDSPHVVLDGFVRQKLPEKILLPMRTPEHHHPECPAEVGRVHDDDHIPRLHDLRFDIDALELVLHPPFTPSEFPSQLLVRLLAVHIFSPQSLLLRASFLTKLRAAIEALP